MLFLLRIIKSYIVNFNVMINSYRAVIESILTTIILVWFGCINKREIKKMESIIRSAEVIIGTPPVQPIQSSDLQRESSIPPSVQFNQSSDLLRESSVPPSVQFNQSSDLLRESSVPPSVQFNQSTRKVLLQNLEYHNRSVSSSHSVFSISPVWQITYIQV